VIAKARLVQLPKAIRLPMRTKGILNEDGIMLNLACPMGGQGLSFPFLPPPPPVKLGDFGQVHTEFVRMMKIKSKITDDQINEASEAHDKMG
jgi:hypothetical protein